MDLSTVSPRIDIPRGHPLRVENANGQRFVVVAGTIWVTQDRDPRDRVIGAGEDFAIDRPGLTVFQALDGSASVARLL
jgi:hypothetical protein